MKQFYYTLRYLLHGKGNSFIKITSLSLGLLVGIVLFARVAFEMSFDKFYPEHDRLYTIMCLYTIGGDSWEPIRIVHAPMPPAFRDEIPEIEYATVTDHPHEKAFLYEDKRYMPVILHADSLFFKTMGLQLLQGDDRLLGVKDNLFVSRTTAKNIFRDEDPIGKVLVGDGERKYTIQGVFEDIPENSHRRFDMVGSFVSNYGPECGWENRDSFVGYVRVVKNADIQAVNGKMAQVIRNHRAEDARIERGTKSEYYLYPVSRIHSGNSNVKRMCLVLSLLAVAILVIAAMNYILISISSLTARARSVGIYKCNGASAAKIFHMFMSETAVLIAVSLVCSVLILLSFRGVIEEITNTSFAGLFSVANLWIPALLIIIIFIVAGYAPGRILSSIPVTQVFRAVSMNKKYWKRGLLFVQFSGVTFIMVLLMIVLFQYRMILDKDTVYDPDGIVYTRINVGGQTEEEWLANVEACKEEFLRIPYVTHASNHYFDLTGNYSGMPVIDTDGTVLFTVRWGGFDFDYLETMGLKLVAGENFKANGQVIVNETFVRMMGWTDSPLGKVVQASKEYTFGEIVGVVEDYPIASLYNEQLPVLIQGYRNCGGYLSLRVAGFDSDKLTELNEKLATMYPDQIKEFTVLQSVLTSQYKSTRQFRDSVTVAFVIVFIIMGMGLFGYIRDEITRRSKEIAIRKVNGATADSILYLLYKDVSWLSMPAVILGVIGALFIGKNWLQEFAVKIPLSFSLLAGSGVGVMVAIFIIVTLCTWRVANENPVDSIKSE